MIRVLLATVHLLALGIGLGSVWACGRALRGTLGPAGLRRVIEADTWWGIAALLWISSGLVRLLGGYEKGAGYYLHNHMFFDKMALVAAVLVLEVAPMIALIRWRIALARGATPDTRHAGRFAWISFVQAGLVVLIVAHAVAMARGFGQD